MLASKAEAMDQAGLVGDFAVSLPQTLSVADTDLCALLGNALDNAMEAALQAARDAGQKKAVLTSNHQLREALRLYERFGFKYVTYSDKWFQLSDIRMEREL